MFGLGATVNEQTFTCAEAVVNVVGHLAEPELKKLGALLKELHEEMKRIQAARAELTRFEARLLQRERTCEAAEAASAKRSADLDEWVQQVQAMQMRIEQKIAELAALKADLKIRMGGV
jgi:CII-binding regulator of phage lambda lysogenization HflD